MEEIEVIQNGDPLKDLYTTFNPKLKLAKSYDEFNAAMQDSNNRKAFFDEFNPKIKIAANYNDFEDVLGLKKKVGGAVSSPIPSKLPSQSVSSPDFEKGQKIAEQGFLIGEGAGKPTGNLSPTNIAQNLRQKTIEKFAEVDAATFAFLRNLSGKLPGANKPEEIYKDGELTKYGQNIPASDFLGRALKWAGDVQQQEKDLQETTGKLPDSGAGRVVGGINNIIPDIALTLGTGGRNLFSGGGKLATLGNKLTGAFVREQGLTGAAKGYLDSEKKGEDAGNTFMNTLKEGGKGVGQGVLVELTSFGAGKLSSAINSKIALQGLKGLTTKEAVKIGATVTAFSLGLPTAESLITKGELPSQEEIETNAGIAAVFAALGAKSGIKDHIKLQNEVKKINDVRNVSALNNFIQAPPEVISDLLKSGEKAEKLNLAAVEAARNAEKATDPEEKQLYAKKSSELTLAADIKHVTDLVINSKDGLGDIAQYLPEGIREQFTQKAQDLHKSLNPSEVQKQGHADEILKAEEIIKQNESLSKDTNPNVLERFEAQRKVNEANKIIEENTKNLNTVLDKQAKEDTKNTPVEKISEQEYNDFVNDGVVSENIINNISNKIKNREQLTEIENQIFHDKTDLINENLKNSFYKENANEINIEDPLKKEQKDITVSEIVDRTGIYNGKKGLFYKDGQTVIFKPEGENKEYEIGNANELKDTPITDLNIKYEEYPIKIDDKGNINIRGNSYINKFSDPLKAINKDSEGNIISVNLETVDGKKRTFRGSIAEDIAYQLNLGKNAEKVSVSEEVIPTEVKVTEEVKPTEAKKFNITEENIKGGVESLPYKGLNDADVSDIVNKIDNNEKLDFKIDSQEFDGKINYTLYSDNRPLGALLVDKNTGEVSDAGVHKALINKGVGSEMYSKVNDIIYKETGKTLKSDSKQISPSAIKLWEKLVKNNKATQIGMSKNGRPLFEMNKPTEKVETIEEIKTTKKTKIEEKIIEKEEPKPTEKESVTNIPPNADEKYVKMANAVNDTFVEGKFGVKALDDITSKLGDTNLENILDKVKENVRLKKDYIKNTVDRVLTTKTGNELDQAALMYDLAELKSKELELQKKIIESKNPKEIAVWQNEILTVQNSMLDNALANKILGREASTIFRLRQIWVNRDLTIGDMVEQYKASKGISELSPSEFNEIKTKHLEMLKLKIEADKARGELEKAREESAKLIIENEKLKELAENADKQKKVDREKKVSETIQKSNERVQKSLDNLRKLGGNLNAGFDPKVAIELGRIAAEKVYQGVVKFDKLVKDVYDDIKDIIPSFTIEDVRTHLLTKANKAGELEPTLLSEQYNNLKKSIDKSEPKIREKEEKYVQAQQAMARKLWEWQIERRQDMMDKKPVYNQVADKILQYQRFNVLAYPTTYIKLISNALFANATKFLLKQPIAYGISKITPKSVNSQQSIYGDPKWSSLAKYYSTWVKNFNSANFKDVMSGFDPKELLYGRPIMYDELNATGSWMEIPGRSHGYVKSFIKNPEFAWAHEQQMVFNLEKMGEITKELEKPNLSKLEKKALKDKYEMYDVTNEDVIERINQQSLIHAKWSIFMNDNKFTDKFKKFTRDNGLLGQYAQSELPIVKIPVNWVGRAFATKYGLFRAVIGKSGKETGTIGGTAFPGIAELIFKGTKNLNESQANLLGRTLQMGTLGAAFALIGIYNYDKIHKNEDGSYEIFGKHISKYLMHIAELESVISAAETAKKYKEDDQSLAEAWATSDMEMFNNNPFFNFFRYGSIPQLISLSLQAGNPKTQSKADISKVGDIMSKKVADMIVSGALKQTATSLDTEEPGFHPFGETTKRAPAGEPLDRWMQTFLLGIPFLRENVPTIEKGEQIKGIRKDMKGESLKEARKELVKDLLKDDY